MIPNGIGCFSMGDLPNDFSLIEVNGRNAAPWWFHKRKPHDCLAWTTGGADNAIHV